MQRPEPASGRLGTPYRGVRGVIVSEKYSVPPGNFPFSARTLTVTESTLEVSGAWRSPPLRVLLPDVWAVFAHADSVEVEWTADGGIRSAVHLQPATPADRERLLWELAVRIPDAIERGLEGGAASG